MWLSWRLFLSGIGILGRRRRDLILENLILRQQLAVWERSARRPRLHRRDRQFWSVTARGWTAWRAHLRIVQPATVVGWHRLAWRRYWRWKSRGAGPGRAPIDLTTRELILRRAAENPVWGVRRIAAELRVLGHPVSAATVYRYRGRPTPSPSGRTFLRLYAPDIWAADFFTVQTPHLEDLLRLFRDQPRSPPHWALERHPASQRPVGVAADPGGHAVEFASPLLDPRPRSDLRRRLRRQGRRDRDHDGFDAGSRSEGDRARRARDRLHPAGGSRPPHRAHRTTPPVGAPRIRGVLQRDSAASGAWRRTARRAAGIVRGRRVPTPRQSPDPRRAAS